MSYKSCLINVLSVREFVYLGEAIVMLMLQDAKKHRYQPASKNIEIHQLNLLKMVVYNLTVYFSDPTHKLLDHSCNQEGCV